MNISKEKAQLGLSGSRLDQYSVCMKTNSKQTFAKMLAQRPMQGWCQQSDREYQSGCEHVLCSIIQTTRVRKPWKLTVDW
jgi:hypothetical protein